MADVGITPVTNQFVAAQTLVNTVGVLKTLNLHLFSNTVGITPQTPLSAFTECVFPGYSVQANWSAVGPYVGFDSLIHADFPDYVFIAAAGQSEQMTNVVAGTITTPGTVVSIVTAAGMTGSPVTVDTTVALGDTAAQVALKILASLSGNADVAAFFNVSLSGTTLTLTAKTPANNDATYNIALADGTAVGLTAAPTATITRTGSSTGSNVNDSVSGYFLTTADNTQLALSGLLANPVGLTAPGQGGIVSPEWIYGQ